MQREQVMLAHGKKEPGDWVFGKCLSLVSQTELSCPQVG